MAWQTVEWNGESLTVEQWARRTGISGATIRSRLEKGWPVERALTEKPDRRFRDGGRRLKAASFRPPPKLRPRPHRGGQAYVSYSAGGKKQFVYLGPFGSQEARDRYAQFCADWIAGQQQQQQATVAPVDPGQVLTVGGLITRYLGWVEPRYRRRGKPTSQLSLIRSALRPVNLLRGDRPAKAFGPNDLRAVRAAYLAPPDPVSRDTANRYTGLVRQMFAFAVGHELLPVAVHEALQRVEPLRRAEGEKRERVTPAPAADVEAILAGDHLSPSPERRAVLAAMVRVQLLTGMRPQDVCGLTAGEVDRSVTPWAYRPGEHKTAWRGQQRAIFFGPRARAILAPLLDGRPPTAPVFALPRARVPGRSRPVAPSPRFYRDAIAEACERAGVAPFAPNQLRHTAATRLHEVYESDAAVAAVLGNTPEIARQVYVADAGDAVARRIAEEVG